MASSFDPPAIEIVAWDATWPDKFAREREVLLPTLARWLAGDIEHIGSTAVPGLPAKPVIDILVPVHSLSESWPAIAHLYRHNYVYYPYKAKQMHWFCKPDPYQRTHHLHMVPVDSALYRERLSFRDALRGDHGLRERYAALKTELAATHPYDREAYTDGKGPFVSQVLDAVARDQSRLLCCQA